MIISNPPFHDGMQTLWMPRNADSRRGASSDSGGESRIAATAFLPYLDVLDEHLFSTKRSRKPALQGVLRHYDPPGEERLNIRLYRVGCGVHALSTDKTNYPPADDPQSADGYFSSNYTLVRRSY
ncbi:hypothetical protein ACNKHM_08165 [Shigella sonnei]